MLSVCTGCEPRPPLKGSSSTPLAVRSCIFGQWYDGVDTVIGDLAELDVFSMYVLHLPCFGCNSFGVSMPLDVFEAED